MGAAVPVAFTPPWWGRPLNVVALLLADFGGLAGGASSLLARGIEVVRALESVRRVFVAAPTGAATPRGSLAVPVVGDLRGVLERVVWESGPGGSVVIYDPCRTPVGAGVFVRALSELDEQGCEAIVAAAPATDTLKRADADGRIVTTVDRRAMWEIRTPQLYRVRALSAALSARGGDVLSAAMLSGDHGWLPSLLDGGVRVVPLPRESMRVERPGDVRVVERLLAPAR